MITDAKVYDKVWAIFRDKDGVDKAQEMIVKEANHRAESDHQSVYVHYLLVKSLDYKPDDDGEEGIFCDGYANTIFQTKEQLKDSL